MAYRTCKFNNTNFGKFTIGNVVSLFLSRYVYMYCAKVSYIKYHFLICMFFYVSGGLSIGCPGNAGAAGTYFNADLHSLRVGNDNVTTDTETPLLDFPTRPLWSHVFVENNAKVLVPLLWTRVQVSKILYFSSLLL